MTQTGETLIQGMDGQWYKVTIGGVTATPSEVKVELGEGEPTVEGELGEVDVGSTPGKGTVDPVTLITSADPTPEPIDGPVDMGETSGTAKVTELKVTRPEGLKPTLENPLDNIPLGEGTGTFTVNKIGTVISPDANPGGDVGSKYLVGTVASAGNGMAAAKSADGASSGKTVDLGSATGVYTITSVTTNFDEGVSLEGALGGGGEESGATPIPVNVTLEANVDSSTAQASVTEALTSLEGEEAVSKPITVTAEASVDTSAAQAAASAAVQELGAPESVDKPVNVKLSVSVDSSGAQAAIDSAVKALGKSETITKTVTVKVNEVTQKSSSGSSSSGSSSSKASANTTPATPVADATPVMFRSMGLTDSGTAEDTTSEPGLTGMYSLFDTAYDDVSTGVSSGIEAAEQSLADVVQRVALSISSLDFTPDFSSVFAASDSMIKAASNTGGTARSDAQDGETGTSSSGITQNVTINAPNPLSPSRAARELRKVAQDLALRAG
ncbi:hypothetical protein FACS1894184_11750 [Clostridia bacterium]|nr:hypothetical protein FACS1894184_11750 [Clostridia bacterium]